MPRKAKTNEENKELVSKKKSKVLAKDTKANAEKKVTRKTTKKTEKPKSKVAKKTTKKAEASKKIKTKKIAKKVETPKTKTTKKTKATKTKLVKNTKKQVKKFLPEYYDLPYRYNETIVKILAQTPKKLFIYWDISDKDRKKYIKVFGENFFNETYPVLLIRNIEMDYTFEVVINDFANSWYVDINDPKCKYEVKLGRKFKNINNTNIDYNVVNNENINLKNDYLEITMSNKLEVPNDHILFEKLGKTVKYRNIKTLDEYEKNIENIISKNGNYLNTYYIYEFYKKIYKNEIDENIFDINNPSSGNTSSKLQYR